MRNGVYFLHNVVDSFKTGYDNHLSNRWANNNRADWEKKWRYAGVSMKVIVTILRSGEPGSLGCPWKLVPS